MKSLQILVVDDEALARERLARLLIELGCTVLAQLRHGRELLEWLSTGQRVDGIFLDINMPGGSGLEILAELESPPPVVFVSAHSDHAIRAFDTTAVDYLLKPVYKERLERALTRLIAQQSQKQGGESPLKLAPPHRPSPAPEERFPVKAGTGLLFLEFKRVSHFEVIDEIVWAWSGGQKFRTSWASLSEVEDIFPDGQMLRIQRHQLLRPEAVLGLQSLSKGRCKVLVPKGVELEVSRTATPRLRERLGIT